MAPGDRLAFYLKRVGVVAEALIVAAPENKRLEWFSEAARFSWAVRVKNTRYFFEKPVRIDAVLRSRLEVFRVKEYATWAWFVQSASVVSDHDFDILVGRR